LPPTTGKLTSEPIAKARLVFPAFAELTKIEGKKQESRSLPTGAKNE